MASPLEQFELKRLVTADVMGYDVSFTNSALFMVITVVAVGLFLCAGLVGSLRLADRREQEVELERRRRQCGTPLPR